MKISLFSMFKELVTLTIVDQEEASAAVNLNHDFLSYLKIKTVLLLYLMVYF